MRKDKGSGRARLSERGVVKEIGQSKVKRRNAEI